MTENAGPDNEAEPGRFAIPALAAGVGASGGYLMGGVSGALIGGIAAPYLEELFRRSADELRGDRKGRAEDMLHTAGEAAGLVPDQLAEQLRKSPRSRFLTDTAIRAAADTFWPPSVRALGRALVAGLDQTDAAVIDIPKMVLPAMTEMVASHLRLLELMVMWRWDDSLRQTGYRGAVRIDAPETEHFAHIESAWTAWQMKSAVPSLEPILGSLIGALDRHGLVERNDLTAEALTKFSEASRRASDRRNPVIRGVSQQRPPVISSFEAERIAPKPSWSPTALGEKVLGYYDLATDEV